MDPGNLVAAFAAAYVGGTLVLHRLRLARQHRDGLELNLLRRIDPAAVPEKLRPALEALAQAEVARVQGDAASREREARVALGQVRAAGGARSSSALAYLDAQIRLGHLVTPLNVELLGIATLLQLRRALTRFGPSPELHQALAHAHAVLGQTATALDELGRAVYYARGAPFYAELVLASAYVEQARPRLRESCTSARAP